MGGLVEVTRHLHGQYPARRQEAHQVRQKMGMVRDPLQRGIGDDAVQEMLRLPRCQVRFDKLETSMDRQPRRRGQHVW